MTTAYPDVLTNGQIEALGTRARAGDLEARDELVTRNLRLVEFSLNSFVRHELYEDMVAEGRLALIEVATTWKPERGSFSTYARAAIRNKAVGLVRAEERQEKIHASLAPRPVVYRGVADGQDGDEMRYLRRWAYTSGGRHRPAFEDQILAKIDADRAVYAKLRQEERYATAS